MFKKTGGGFTLIALILAGCVLVLKDFPGNVRTGIDLEGGTELVFAVDLLKLPADKRPTAVNEIKLILQNRFDSFGIKELSIAPRGNDSLVIQVPGTDDSEIDGYIDQVEKSGKLTIHLISKDEWQTPEKQAGIRSEWATYNVQRSAAEAGQTPERPRRWVVKDDGGASYTVEYYNSPEGDVTWVDGAHLSKAFRTVDEVGNRAVGFEFKAAGGAQFGAMTEAHHAQSADPGRLAIVLDGTSKSIASINQRISNSGILQGQYTEDEVTQIVTLLNSGSLPVSPQYESQSRIGALLGKASVERGTQAMAIGFILVLIFMVIYYHATLGGIASLTLLFNMTMVLTLIIVFRNSVTLPGLAGLLLTIGMAVDANILIYERIREERKRGRSLSQSITTGYDKAFSTIVDANLTTLITAFILFKFGSTAVKGFAVVLSVGIICSVFSALYFSRLVVTWAVNKNLIKDLKMMSVMQDPKFDFLSFRSTARMLSIVLIVIGLATVVIRGKETLGIDFTGGTRLLVNLEEPISEPEMRALLSSVSKADDQIQAVDAVGGKSWTFSLRSRDVVDRNATHVDGTKKSQNAYKEAVGGALEAALAPAPMEAQTWDEVTKVFGVDLNLRTVSSEFLSPEDVKAALTSGNWPVANVTKVEPQPGKRWSRFTVTSTPNPQGVPDDNGVTSLGAPQLRAALLVALKAESSLELSDPFPEVSSIGSRVAHDMQGKVLIAMFLAFAAIIFYISLRFEFKFGLAAIAALVHDILFTVGALAVGDAVLGNVLNLKINLPVVAALLTVVGYSLNDTIVIFDRIRENLAGKKHQDYTPVVNASINQTLSRTVLTSATTFGVALILLVWGGEALHGFAFALTIGVVVGTYSSIYVASPSLIYFHKRSEARREMLLEEAAAGTTSA